MLLKAALMLCLGLESSCLRLGGVHHQRLRPPPLDKASPTPPPEQWFIQPLDHFRPSDGRVWKQRYWINWRHYTPGGPALLMIGGEGKANPAWMEAGSWVKYAQDNGAAMLMLEHRFYGNSRPTPDMSVKNLAWLTSRQALADLARFRVAMSEQFNLTAPWVALGGSYPGSLAAWFRLKYPHLVDGSVSTSGPLLAKADFYEYLQVVEKALETTGPECNIAIKEAFEKVKFLTSHRVGWSMLTRMFTLCSPFDGAKTEDTATLFESLIGNFEGVVQYNKDNRDWEGAKFTNITLNTLCDIMADQGVGSPLQRLANVNLLGLHMEGEKCLEHRYKFTVEDLKATDWNSSAAAGGRQWTYQTCTEFGWYQSSDQPSHIYGDSFPLAYWVNQCTDVFGPRFNQDLLEKGIAATNVEYGAKGIEVSNVVFVHGSIDPWHAMGVTDSPATIFINGTAHCANMYPEREEDLEQLKDARKQVGELIKTWVANKHVNNTRALDQAKLITGKNTTRVL